MICSSSSDALPDGFDELPEVGELREAYARGDAQCCAVAHHNLAASLQDLTTDSRWIQAHLLASAIIFFRLESPLLEHPVGALATQPLDKEPPGLPEIVRRVDLIQGVHFSRFTGSVETLGSVHGAIAAIWTAARQKQVATSDVLAGLPEILSRALHHGDRQQLRSTLSQLTPEEADQALQALQKAGVLESQSAELLKALHQLDHVIERLAASIRDPSIDREPLDEMLSLLEQFGWCLRDPVHRIWSGERDLGRLTAQLPEHERHLIAQLLEQI